MPLTSAIHPKKVADIERTERLRKHELSRRTVELKRMPEYEVGDAGDSMVASGSEMRARGKLQV